MGDSRECGREARKGRAPHEEVDAGGAGVEEDDGVGDERDGVPERVERTALLQLGRHLPLARRRAVQAKHRHRDHACAVPKLAASWGSSHL